MSKNVAVILSGCGVYDGSEIQEAVCTLLHLNRAKCQVQCFAPDIEQMHVINHLNGEEMQPSRNVLVESARIVRGDIHDLKTANPDDFDAVIVPGGFGVAKNLSDFAVSGAEMTVNQEVLAFCQQMHQQGKVVGLMCIAPVLAAKIFAEGVFCTIGTEAEIAEKLEAMGARHQNCAVNEICIDEENKLVTTPAYMLAENIGEVDKGVGKLVAAVLERA